MRISKLKIKHVNSTNCKNKKVFCWTITKHLSDGRAIVKIFPSRGIARKKLKKMREGLEYSNIKYQLHRSILSII